MTTPVAMPAPPRVHRPECSALLAGEPRYSIATLVSDRTHYTQMLASFRAGGFADSDCEYLFIDNTGHNQTDAFRGLNALLNAARAPIVVLCHQDVRLLADKEGLTAHRYSVDVRLDDATGLGDD